MELTSLWTLLHFLEIPPFFFFFVDPVIVFRREKMLRDSSPGRKPACDGAFSVTLTAATCCLCNHLLYTWVVVLYSVGLGNLFYYIPFTKLLILSRKFASTAVLRNCLG